MRSKTPRTAVILMTYGSATVAEHVPAYLKHIYRGKASKELIEDFQKRYRLVGSSPLIEITRNQATLLQKRLGDRYIVHAAMLHSAPFIDDVVARCQKAGAKKIIGIILSPQFSSFIMDGYRIALMNAALRHGFGEEDVHVAKPWPTERHFIKLLNNRIRESLPKLRKLHGANMPVVFTTHSLPERVVSKDPSYLKQLKATTDAVLAVVKDPALQHYSGYQSAGHTPEPWLKPDLVDILASVARKKARAVLIVPIQFLADHLEILYDLDRAGSEQCAERGIAYHRIELPNTDPLFISALAAVAKCAEKSVP